MPIAVVVATIGVGLILLGIKGFTPTGIAFSKKKNLTGTTGKLVGGICIAIGGVFALAGFGIMVLISAKRS